MRSNGGRITLLLALTLSLSPVFGAGPLIICDPDSLPCGNEVAPFAYPPGTVAVLTDLGPMGLLSNERADALTAAGVAEWNAVPTSYFSGAVVGDFGLLGLPDITGANADLVIGADNGGGIHVLYDHDGSIVTDFFGAPPGVVGIGSPDSFVVGTARLAESWVVLNGAGVRPGDEGGAAFAGVFTHEIGHALNLAHSQTNGAVFLFGSAAGPAGCPTPYGGFPTAADLETMYPVIDTFPGGAGIEQATVEHLDDIASISDLYPANGWPGAFPTITGRIVLSDGVSEVSGANVIARNVADPFGDSISALSGAFTQGLFGPDGLYTFNGLTPGADYVVYVDEIVAGGFSTPPAVPLPGREEFFNGAGESSDSMTDDRCESVSLSPDPGTPQTADIIFNDEIITGDDGFLEIVLPFEFPFCGRSYDSVFVGGNGFLTFETGSTELGENVDAFRLGPPRIAPLWDDLNPAQGGSVTAREVTGQFVVSWIDVPEFFNTGSNTFSVTLRPDGTFKFEYGSLSATDGLAGFSPGLGSRDRGETDLSDAPQPIEGEPGDIIYELFAFADNDLSGRTLEWAACAEFEPLINPARAGVFYASTGRFDGGRLLVIDPRNGLGFPVGFTGVDEGVPGLAINSRGEIYGTERRSGDLYRIDAETGGSKLASSPGVPFLDGIAFDANDVLHGVAFDPPAYTLITIDPETGAITPVGPTGDLIVGLAFDPTDGQLYGSTGGFGANAPDGIYRIDPQTGQSTLLGTTGFGAATQDLLFDGAGNLYGLKGGGQRLSNFLIRIDKVTGAGSLIGVIGFNAVSGLATLAPPLAPAELGVLYGSTGLADGGRLIRLDPRTGAGVLLGSTGLGGVPALAVNSKGEIFGAERFTGNLFRIDAMTGRTVSVASTGVRFLDALAFDENDVLYGVGLDRLLRIIEPYSGRSTIVGSTDEDVVGLAFDLARGVPDECMDCPLEVFEHVVNGGFETGDATGWSGRNAGPGGWAINNGGAVPPGPGGALPPISGNFDVLSFQGGPGVHILNQPVFVPTGIQSATLSWSDRIRNFAARFTDPTQEWRVLIKDTDGNVIHEVFSTNADDPLFQEGPNLRSFDLTELARSLEGRVINISFEQQDDLFFFNVNLDDVSFVTVATGRPGAGAPLYGSVGGTAPSPDFLFTIDKATGTSTLLGRTGLGGPTPDIQFDASGGLLGVKGGGRRPNDLISIDPETGDGTVIGPIGFSAVSGLAALVPTIGNLRELVEEIALERPVLNGLMAKLDQAAALLRQGKLRPAANILGAFVHQLEAIRGKAIAEEQADRMIAYAEALIRQLPPATGDQRPVEVNADSDQEPLTGIQIH